MRIAAAPPKNISAATAAALVKSGDWLDYGTSLCQPDVFDKALALRVAELTNVKIRSCLCIKSSSVIPCTYSMTMNGGSTSAGEACKNATAFGWRKRRIKSVS